MADTIVHALAKFPEEAAIVGRILAGYAEIQFMVALCADRALRKEPGDTRHIAIKALYRLMSEASRLKAADALMRDSFVRVGLEGAYAQAYGAAKYCLQLRNQYAHCHWGDDAVAGLFFTNVQDDVEKAADLTFEFNWLHVDAALLQQQEAFCVFAHNSLEYLHAEFSVRAGVRSGHGYSLPRAILRPPLHNPPEEHGIPFGVPRRG